MIKNPIWCSRFHDVLSRLSRGKPTSASQSNNGYQQVVPVAVLYVLLFLRIGTVQNLLLNELKPLLIGSLRHSRVTSAQCHHDLWSLQASSTKQGVHCYWQLRFTHKISWCSIPHCLYSWSDYPTNLFPIKSHKDARCTTKTVYQSENWVKGTPMGSSYIWWYQNDITTISSFPSTWCRLPRDTKGVGTVDAEDGAHVIPHLWRRLALILRWLQELSQSLIGADGVLQG